MSDEMASRMTDLLEEAASGSSPRPGAWALALFLTSIPALPSSSDGAEGSGTARQAAQARPEDNRPWLLFDHLEGCRKWMGEQSQWNRGFAEELTWDDLGNMRARLHLSHQPPPSLNPTEPNDEERLAFSRGEIFLDLENADCYSRIGRHYLNHRLDLSEGGAVAVRIIVLDEAGSLTDAPLRFKLAVADSNSGALDGPPKPLNDPTDSEDRGTVSLRLAFSTATPQPYGTWRSESFDPSDIVRVKIKAELEGDPWLLGQFSGAVMVQSVDVFARAGRIKGPDVFPRTENPIETELLGKTALNITKPSLRDFLERSGLSGYANPGTYGGDLTTRAGFSGVAGKSLEGQFRKLKMLRDEIAKVFPAHSEMQDLRFTDRRFFFADLGKGARVLPNGALEIDHRLAEENIRAYMKLSKDFNMSVIPVLFDYRLCKTHSELFLEPAKGVKLIESMAPELKVLAEYPNVLAIEPMNEPDVDMTGDEKHLVSGIDPKTERYTYIPLRMRQDFVARTAEAIRRHARKPVSFSAVSGEMLKYWIHLYRKGDIANFHYYTKAHYTADDVVALRGLTLDRGRLNIPEGVSVMVGEFQPSNSSGDSIFKEVFGKIRKLRYAGGLLWWVHKDFVVDKNLPTIRDDMVQMAMDEGFTAMPRRR